MSAGQDMRRSIRRPAPAVWDRLTSSVFCAGSRIRGNFHGQYFDRFLAGQQSRDQKKISNANAISIFFILPPFFHTAIIIHRKKFCKARGLPAGLAVDLWSEGV